MRIFKHRNLLGCLFAIILAMPLINIGVRCAYTIFNKNAKDSYSGYEVQITETQTDFYNMVSGETYIFKTDDVFTFVPSNTTGFMINVSDFVINNVKYETGALNFLYNSNTQSLRIQVVGTQDNFYSYSYIFNLKFTFQSAVTITTFAENINEYLYHYQLNSVGSTLDNAFDYSISKITDSNNIGELKFFTWFADIFLDLDNSSNALYINFINWYFNYALLVSAVYILFLALMWFIMWVRKLLERGMDFGNRSW